MSAEPAVDEALVSDLALAMLERVAAVEPAQVAAERRAFDVLRAAYFADPRRALGGGDRGGGQLTFGLPGIEELLTPVLLAASAEVVRYLAERGAAASRRGVRRLLRLPADGPSAAAGALPGRVQGAADPTGTPDPTVPELTADQWDEVRGIVAQALVRHSRMSPQRAELIAAAVVGEGVTAKRP